MTNPQHPAVALTIAGLDSGGGAGIAADLHTFAAHHVFGTVALTAATAQDTQKVHDVVEFEPSFVQAQIDAVLGDFSVKVAKTGMLATSAIVDSLTERAARGLLPMLVVDPVMISSTGSSLLEGNGCLAYQGLLRHASVATPNLPEAEVLCDRPITSVAAMADAAKAIYALGAKVVVVKGGHLGGDSSTDVVFDGSELHYLRSARIATANTHGTGCTLSAAITANLSLGLPVLEAIAESKEYVTRAIRSSAAWRLGGGNGPIDHFARND